MQIVRWDIFEMRNKAPGLNLLRINARPNSEIEYGCTKLREAFIGAGVHLKENTGEPAQTDPDGRSIA